MERQQDVVDIVWTYENKGGEVYTHHTRLHLAPQLLNVCL